MQHYEQQIAHLKNLASQLTVMLAEAELQKNITAASDCRKQLFHIENELRRILQEKQKEAGQQ